MIVFMKVMDLHSSSAAKSSSNISYPGQYKTWTADYGLGIKHGLGYKTRAKPYGLGIKYGLRYKTRTEHYGLGIKHEES